jgi:hypothetical protein
MSNWNGYDGVRKKIRVLHFKKEERTLAMSEFNGTKKQKVFRTGQKKMPQRQKEKRYFEKQGMCGEESVCCTSGRLFVGKWT